MSLLEGIGLLALGYVAARHLIDLATAAVLDR